ncbi:DUF871 domain-containing protein [Pediococcus ethanolidurans]|uniref:Outer surface protein n=1 Tax=Pediococcus ethanolidurans TaxID=319653 RepID=A0A0R2K631_9LACO|nr:MupG family TIM beta-alpha barrel fold protein [Pediococcus ethanolidurans]KRN81668.1 outer surface protein [Pediococcus ethanolidurans]GEN95820.1 PTS-associated protein [Pediococcus ethanolidurans]SER85536.1 hypothetical protein SAMN04487973_12112 [Pediococcus ethanolidurans]
MLGFSIYLDTEIDDQTKRYIELMKQNGFEGVFSSVHIPEDDASKYVERLKKLGEYCKAEKLKLTVDLDLKGLENLNVTIHNAKKLLQMGISALRLDDGFTNAEIAELSHQLPVALNASTINENDVKQLIDNQANFEHMEAWHNYYPRPETGLDTRWFKTKNVWLKAHHFTVMAFVPGDAKMRGPIFAGLPTIENHRHENSLVAADELINEFEVDKVFIGDPRISNQLMSQFQNFYSQNTLQLHVQTKYTKLFGKVWHNRPEVAQDVVRLVESRKQNQLTKLEIEPENQKIREFGAITIDNQEYGRYQGEIQICKVSLPKDKRVNVIGQISKKDLKLLALVRENTGIEFLMSKEETR